MPLLFITFSLVALTFQLDSFPSLFLFNSPKEGWGQPHPQPKPSPTFLFSLCVDFYFGKPMKDKCSGYWPSICAETAPPACVVFSDWLSIVRDCLGNGRSPREPAELSRTAHVQSVVMTTKETFVLPLLFSTCQMLLNYFIWRWKWASWVFLVWVIVWIPR